MFPELFWENARRDLLPICIAYVLALPIGYDRARRSYGAGLRTFPLVSIASCGLALIGVNLGQGSADALSRVIQGLVTGIGFIGAGAILKGEGGVTGTATAASVWNIGIVGLAAGFGFYSIAIFLSFVNFVTLRFLAVDKNDKPPAAISEQSETS